MNKVVYSRFPELQIITDHEVLRTMAKPIPIPEIPTLAERLISALRLPYIAGCLFVGFVVFGPQTVILLNYLKTSDFGAAVSSALGSGLGLTTVIGVGGLPAFIAYVFYVPRYMRTRILVAQRSLSVLSKDVFHGLFETVSSPRPQLVLWLFVVIFVGPVQGLLAGSVTAVPDIAGGFLFGSFFGLGISSLVWAYFASLRAIHRLGAAPLNFRPHYEDPFLGLKPVGSLVLSLAVSHFGFVVVLLVLGSTSPAPGATFYSILSMLILLGLLMFFLPLRRLHKVMVEQKGVESDRLGKRLSQRVQNPGDAGSPADFSQMLLLDVMERKVSAIHTWPFDLNILGKLTVIVLSVTAALIARLIAATLGI